MKLLLSLLAATALSVSAAAQALNPPGKPYSTKTAEEYPHTGEPAFGPVTQLFDVRIRDTCICRGPDGSYYLTGTTGENIWVANEGIELWRSQDLKTWEHLGLVWTIERDGTWQKQWTEKNGRTRRAVWAPEIHYLKGNFYIACWWSTIFGNDKSAPLHERPGILRIEFDRDGHIRPLVEAQATK